MAKKVRSARGEMVDFDLLKIKEQIANQPPPQDVRARQDFIEKRLRRRLKKAAPPAPPVQRQDKDATVKADPKMPGTEELTEEPKKIDEVEDEPKTTSRQKARPPAKDNE
jgi:hypothetical protein